MPTATGGSPWGFATWPWSAAGLGESGSGCGLFPLCVRNKLEVFLSEGSEESLTPSDTKRRNQRKEYF